MWSLLRFRKPGLMQELFGQADDLGREGGREHEGADVPIGQVRLHAHHVGVEAHREHAVGLVENQELQVLERQRPPQQVVEDAPGVPITRWAPALRAASCGP